MCAVPFICVCVCACMYECAYMCHQWQSHHVRHWNDNDHSVSRAHTRGRGARWLLSLSWQTSDQTSDSLDSPDTCDRPPPTHPLPPLHPPKLQPCATATYWTNSKSHQILKEHFAWRQELGGCGRNGIIGYFGVKWRLDATTVRWFVSKCSQKLTLLGSMTAQIFNSAMSPIHLAKFKYVQV